MPYLSGLWKDALLDSTPMKDMITQYLEGKPFKRKITYQAVDLNTGRVVTFDERIPEDMKIASVLSSGSIPGFFSP